MFKFIKKIWNTGDDVLPADLNRYEEGIYNNEQLIGGKSVAKQILDHNKDANAHQNIQEQINVLSNTSFEGVLKLDSGDLLSWITQLPLGKGISVHVSAEVTNTPIPNKYFLMQIFRNKSTGDTHIQAQEFVNNNLTGSQWVADLWNFTSNAIAWKQIPTTDNTIICKHNVPTNTLVKTLWERGVYTGTFDKSQLPPQLAEYDGQGRLEIKTYSVSSDTGWAEYSWRSAHMMHREFVMSRWNKTFTNWVERATTDKTEILWQGKMSAGSLVLSSSAVNYNTLMIGSVDTGHLITVPAWNYPGKYLAKEILYVGMKNTFVKLDITGTSVTILENPNNLSLSKIIGISRGDI